MPQPLAGLKVVDFTHVVAGPLATHFLRLLGAEVIKIESPAGDPLRNYSLVPSERGMAPAFVGINAGKKSVVLDLKSEDGLATARALIAGADIVVENFRPDVLDRLGLGFEACKQLKPDILYCSVSGFGLNSPLKHHPAIDQIVQSLSGLMKLSGEPDDGPIRIGIPIVDTFVGVMAALAILSAVIQRDRFGGAQQIDVAMLDAALTFLSPAVCEFTIAGHKQGQMGNQAVSRRPTANLFRVKDGHLLLAVNNDRQYAALLKCLGLEALDDDPRFRTWDDRLAHEAELRDAIEAVLASDDARSWERRLSAAGAPCASSARP